MEILQGLGNLCRFPRRCTERSWESVEKWFGDHGDKVSKRHKALTGKSWRKGSVSIRRGKFSSKAVATFSGFCSSALRYLAIVYYYSNLLIKLLLRFTRCWIGLCEVRWFRRTSIAAQVEDSSGRIRAYQSWGSCVLSQVWRSRENIHGAWSKVFL